MHPEKTRQLIEREWLRRGRDGMKYCETAIEALNGDRRATFVGWHTKLSPGRTAAPTIAALQTSCFYASLLVAIRFCTLIPRLTPVEEFAADRSYSTQGKVTNKA